MLDSLCRWGGGTWERWHECQGRAWAFPQEKQETQKTQEQEEEEAEEGREGE